MYRHGDLLLIPRSIPPSAERCAAGEARTAASGTGIVLAEGEATGHRHVITPSDGHVQVLRIPGMQDLVIEVSTGAVLTHEEHNTITLPAGWYDLRRQREYVAPSIAPRRVRD